MNRNHIVLASANARYGHTAIALRWLKANLGRWSAETTIREFTIRQSPLEIAEALLAEEPRVIGLGVYIWNVLLMAQVVQILKAVAPDVIVVLGGPEASHEYEGTALFLQADYLIRGEGEWAFSELVEAIMEERPPTEKVLSCEPPDLMALAMPYDEYTDHDIQHRILYVEASRGCPFRCDYCLSSIDRRVREFPLEPLFQAILRLMDRGARQFRFIDRTFNLNDARARTILQFFGSHWEDGMQIHLEILPDRLTPEALQEMAQFPPGGIHIEAGVQTFTPAVLELISRRQDNQRAEQNLRLLREETGCLVHADLIAGLPGETWESFAESFDRLIAIRPHELQMGILKRLKGTTMASQFKGHRLAFTEFPPYEVLETDLMSFAQLQRLKRFARYLDLFHNTGNFPQTLPLLWATRSSTFEAFMAFSDFVWARTGRTHEISLANQTRHLVDYLLQTGIADQQTVAQAAKDDFHRLPGRKDRLGIFP